MLTLQIVGFWRSKVALDKKTALSQGRSGSPPRITPGSLGAAGGAGGGRSSPGGSPPPRPRPQTPFLVGIDGEIVRMATGKASGGGGGGGVGGGGGGGKGSKTAAGTGEVWGVASSESCMVPAGAEV